MRIERINENSIRCILSSFDLSVRNLNIKELAYGSDKARKLFNEMMQKANAEVGFDAENTPIMIEAIPMGGNSIQLIITKVDEPEELDTRFSKFSPFSGKQEAEDWIKKLTKEILEGADNILSQTQKKSAPEPMFKTEAPTSSEINITPDNKDSFMPPIPGFRAFAFNNLDQVITATKAAKQFTGYSDLFKRPDDGLYVLAIYNHSIPDEDFAKVCNLIAEYGRKIKTTNITLSYYEEHYKVICRNSAIQKLAGI